MTGPDPTIPVRTEALCRRYRSAVAVDDVTITLRPGVITGLLGRNAAGKSTLMRLIAAQELASSGAVEVFGESPFENPDVQHRMVFVREDQTYPDFKVRHALAAAGWSLPNWSAELAAVLVRDFEVPLGRPIKKLSRGQRSALGIVIGLASRADLTLLDEPYAGLDPVARRMFYGHLLADYAEHPRTVLLSTHLVDEVADLLEQVLLIDHGRITLDAPADEVRGRAVTVSGPREAVARFSSGRTVRQSAGLGSQARATVVGSLTDTDRVQARAAGLVLEPVTLQELLVQGAAPAAVDTVGPAAAPGTRGAVA